MKVYIDGEFFDRDEARVSVFDHGLLYGDGVFEGIRVYGGRLFRLREHVVRLFDSAKAILLGVPMGVEELEGVVCEACVVNGVVDGYVRVMVTRGVGSLGLDPGKCGRPSVIVMVCEVELYGREFYECGLAVVTASTVRNLGNAVNPAIKSLNYLNNVLARVEASNAGCEEAIMLNGQGLVAECSGDNIFVVRDGCVYTPPLSAGALYGITRGVVMGLAREDGLEVGERDLSRYDVFVADECFLTGTAAEVVPVVKVDGRVIGGGVPGPVTRGLMGRYRELTRREGVPVGGGDG